MTQNKAKSINGNDETKEAACWVLGQYLVVYAVLTLAWQAPWMHTASADLKFACRRLM